MVHRKKLILIKVWGLFIEIPCIKKSRLLLMKKSRSFMCQKVRMNFLGKIYTITKLKNIIECPTTTLITPPNMKK